MKKSVRYSIAAVSFMVAGLVVSALFLYLTSGTEDKTAELSGRDRSLISRTCEITGSVYEDRVMDHAGNGIYSIGDFVIRSLTSADYYSLRRTDGEFASDLAYIVNGERDERETEEVLSYLDGHTRMYAVNEYIRDVDESYAATSDIAADPGDSVTSFSVTRSIQGDDGYTIGIRKVEGEFNVTGGGVRTDFFVDGTLYQGNINISDEVSEDGSRGFMMAWDTAGVSSGEHDVRILIRSSDGRGDIADGGHITVPYCMNLINDCVQQGSIDPGSSESWYMLDAGERNAYINFVAMSDDIKVTLYDALGDQVGTNDLPDSDYEVLRGRMQDPQDIEEDTGVAGASNAFYVRVRRGDGAEDTDQYVSYTMVQSREVARYNGEYLAVLDDGVAVPTPIPVVGNSSGEHDITVRDLNNNEYTVSSEAVSFLPLEGCLFDMRVQDTNGGRSLGVFPSFTPGNVSYGYYLDDPGRQVSVSAVTQEGYAASLDISITDKMGTRDLMSGQIVELIPGESVFDVSVTSFDGNVRSYKVYILNGDDDGDFFEGTLSAFPASYRSGLWMLHNVQPNYIFRPYDTGLDFYTVLSNEDHYDRSLANINSTPGWVVPDSPVYDGGGWMTARTNVVRYFLDPRNFFDQRRIFQFELLSFDESCHTVDGVRTLIAGSFLDTPDYDYATAIYNAGRTANVSPYFLASKIIQEMGYNGQSQLCHGTLPGYEGYYNFYNIGSTPDPQIENGALINGARYAMWGQDPDGQVITAEEAELLLPWDNVEDALTGGALWIASRYTAAGQDTLYFQKFDVIDNNDGLYEHQYAQNVSMAYEESYRYFSGYASIDMLDRQFVFVIPVYSSMPDDFGIMPDKQTGG